MTNDLSEKRKGRVTGSSVGAILGYDPWRTRRDVMRMMVREHFDATPEFDGNPATEWGKANEAGAMMSYTMETGRRITKSGFFISPNHDWLGATPDGALGNDGLIEVKCPYGKRHDPAPVAFRTIGEQKHYFAQMQTEMLCTGTNWVDFWQWTMNDHSLVRVERDDIFIDWMVPELYGFYLEYLQIIGDEEASAPYLAPKKAVIDNDNARRLVDKYRKLKKDEKAAKEASEALLKEIVAAAGNVPSTFGGASLSLVNRSGAVSYAKVVEEKLPGLDLKPWTGAPTSYWQLK